MTPKRVPKSGMAGHFLVTCHVRDGLDNSPVASCSARCPFKKKSCQRSKGTPTHPLPSLKQLFSVVDALHVPKWQQGDPCSVLHLVGLYGKHMGGPFLPFQFAGELRACVQSFLTQSQCWVFLFASLQTSLPSVKKHIIY